MANGGLCVADSVLVEVYRVISVIEGPSRCWDDLPLRLIRCKKDEFPYSTIMFALLQLPAFFDGHHSYDIYDANVKFENNLSPRAWSTDTRRSYRMFLESSRMALKLSFSQTTLDLIKITKDVDQGKIEARWRVRGRPRYFLSLKERLVFLSPPPPPEMTCNSNFLL